MITFTIRNIIQLFSCLVFFLFSCNEKVVLTDTIELAGFPSGSGIEYKRGTFYLCGDDATHLLLLDSMFKIIDSISLSFYSGKRIPKNSKPDAEAATFIFGDRFHLLLAGSGSLSPHRNSVFIIETNIKQVTAFSVDTFYKRLKNYAVSQINIEGAASTPWGMILSNRGNKSFPKNQLIITSNNFWKNQADASIKIISIGNNIDTNAFQGISGLCYSGISDRLLITVSTEDTYNTREDGAIGKSYLWIINDVSAKQKFSAINPNSIIDLSVIDKKLINQKIESVCIIAETNKKLVLGLTADNDDGKTMLFKIIVQK